MNAAAPQELTPAWLRVKDAERYAGLSRSTLAKLIASGEVEASKVGKALRVNRESLDEYMGRHAIKH
jgi:excisionase family DNA binding protein